MRHGPAGEMDARRTSVRSAINLTRDSRSVQPRPLQERDVPRLTLEGSRQHRDSLRRVAAEHCAVQFDYAMEFPRTARHPLVQYEMCVVLDAHVSITAVVVTLEARARSRRQRAHNQFRSHSR